MTRRASSGSEFALCHVPCVHSALSPVAPGLSAFVKQTIISPGRGQTICLPSFQKHLLKTSRGSNGASYTRFTSLGRRGKAEVFLSDSDLSESRKSGIPPGVEPAGGCCHLGKHSLTFLSAGGPGTPCKRGLGPSGLISSGLRCMGSAHWVSLPGSQLFRLWLSEHQRR